MNGLPDWPHASHDMRIDSRELVQALATMFSRRHLLQHTRSYLLVCLGDEARSESVGLVARDL